MKKNNLTDFDMAFFFFWIIPFFYLFFFQWLHYKVLEYGAVVALLGFVITSIFIYSVFGIKDVNEEVKDDALQKQEI